MKYVVVGGVAGGASAAARLRRLDEKAEVIMFEKDPHVSFSNCALPYRLSGTVGADEALILMTPEKFKGQYNIDARTMSEVTKIDRENKKVIVKKLTDGTVYEESYDKLVLAPGASAVIPPIKGIETADVFQIKNVMDITKLHEFLHRKNAENVTVVGGGFIGAETAENLKKGGYHVTLVESMPQILKTLDHDMVQILQKEMLDQGIDLIVNEQVISFKNSDVTLSSGKEIKGDAVVMAAGIRPNSELAGQAGLELTEKKFIKVDQNYRTNDPDIYAVGDAVQVFNAITHKPMNLALAGPALRQARCAADHICGLPVRNTGFIGSNCIRLFDYNAAATGLTAAQCREEGISFDSVFVIPQDKIKLMPDSVPLFFKLIYEMPTGKILGAQAVSKGDAVKRVDVVAAMIKLGGTVEDLKDMELCYAPPFSTARNAENTAGMVASNLMHKTYRHIAVTEARRLVEEGAYLLDTREANEFEASHLKNAVNIPLSRLRDRTDELPHDRTIYVYCHTARRSYNACLALQERGFRDVVNMAGGFLGISMYEYFNDVTLKRDPIVTDYIFK